MDTNTIFAAISSVTVIGVICAAVLCIASKFMNVKDDERLAQLAEIMPGANCGACGFPGCTGFAKALISGDAKTNQCPPGGAELIVKISGILGLSGADTEGITKKTAVVYCSGDISARQKKMEYKGIQSCAAAKQLFAGESACAFGCLGYGDCQIACPCSAICMEEDLARIIMPNCTGCGLCVKACPNKLISIVNADTPVFTACKNIEKGAAARKKCTSACIACGKCVRECPGSAIVMENNLAVINYEKCKLINDKQSCGHCIEVCVTKCIKGIELLKAT